MSGSWKGFGYCHGCQWWETTVSEHAFHRRCARGEESCLRENVLNYSLLNHLGSYRIFWGKYLTSKNDLDLNVIWIKRLVWKLYVFAQNTTSGSSIYKVQAVDRDIGSGGSVTYFLQVTSGIHLKYQTWTQGQMKVQDYFFFSPLFSPFCSLLQSLIEYPYKQVILITKE